MNTATKILFLDDERVPADVTWMSYPAEALFTVVRNSAQFFDELFRQEFDIVSFDHDIQEFVKGNEVTGYHILKELVDICLQNDVVIPQCVFHTQNPIGKKNMECYYQNAVKFQEQVGVEVVENLSADGER